MLTIPLDHDLVLRHPRVTLDRAVSERAFLEIEPEVQTLEVLYIAVAQQRQFAYVLQMVVIPLFSNFPTFDFIVYSIAGN